MKKTLEKLALLTILPLINLAIPSPVKAERWNQFSICAVELQRSGIAPDKAGNACAHALDPQELSLCVIKIGYLTSIKGEDALNNCMKVRRPVEFATCITDIHYEINTADINTVMDHCRRSLLPNRFSECVIGINRYLSLSPADSLHQCISTDESRTISQ